MRCPKCQSENVNVQAVAEIKKRGCLTTLIYIVLACTIVGLIIVIPLIRGQKSKTKTYAICQNCGYKWKT
jgi:predicted Zn-ribbon and HTH transcriptional regulator